MIAKNWKVSVAKQKNIGVGDIFTVKTISPSLNCTNLLINQYFFLSKAIIQDTFFLTCLYLKAELVQRNCQFCDIILIHSSSSSFVLSERKQLSYKSYTSVQVVVEF
jgi:hypothetical protein